MASSPAPPDRLALVGLTGGIGSGKSTVARMIADLGVPVIDADQIARDVVNPGRPAHAEIAAAWPDVIGADGVIDRAALARMVFSDPDSRARLEAITHPRIRQASREAAEGLQAAGHRLAFYEAALLVEVGRHKDFDALAVVAVPQKQQIERAIARGQQTEAEVLARLAAQLPLDKKIKAATHVINNSGDLASTKKQVEALVAELRGKFAGPPERKLRAL